MKKTFHKGDVVAIKPGTRFFDWGEKGDDTNPTYTIGTVTEVREPDGGGVWDLNLGVAWSKTRGNSYNASDLVLIASNYN